MTGASGFLGSTLCRRLIESGHSVTAFVRPGSTHPALDALPVHRVEGDITDAAAVRKSLRGCHVAIHTAFVGRYARAQARLVWQVNAIGTRTFVESCLAEDVDRAVVVNSISTLATSGSPQIRSPDPSSRAAAVWLFPYISSMLAARDAVERCGERLNVAMLLCSPMYGAGDKHAHTGGLINHLARRPIRYAPPGGTSIVSVSDAADACLRAAESHAPRGSFVVASEHHSFLSIYNLILRALGSDRCIDHVLPRWLYAPALAVAAVADTFQADGWFCPNVVRNGFRFRNFSADATRAAFGWSPRVSLEQAVMEQVSWMRRHGQLPNRTGSAWATPDFPDA